MTSNIDIVYTVEKNFSLLVWIRDHYLKIRSIWLKLTGKVLPFCTKKRTDNPGIFISNGGCHWDEKDERNLLAPSLAREQLGTLGSHDHPMRGPLPPTVVIGQLESWPSPTSACLASKRMVRALNRRSTELDLECCMSRFSERNKRERERMSKGERERERLGEGGGHDGEPC